MKTIYCSLLLLVFILVVPVQGHTESTTTEKMPSWEGVYCNEASKNCLKIYEQSPDTAAERGYYAQIMFFNKARNVFIGEGELKIRGPKEGDYDFFNLARSDDGKNITVDPGSAFSSRHDDDINNYGLSLLFGTYTRVQ